MKSKPMFRWRQRLHSYPRRWGQKTFAKFPQSFGFTLIELLVASLLVSVVILVAWTGLLSVMNMTQAAEARSARQMELNRALDFMTNEIRMARFINQSATAKANGSTVPLANVVTSTGLPLTALGSYGDIGLYLERDTSPNIPAICPAGGPNAGLPPPSPADYDRIVYDIRPSPSGWLSPKILTRYGRVPGSDGSLNPCSNPISGDPMVDALAATRTPPACSGVLSGNGGFYSCVTDNQADLLFQSAISNVGARQVSSSVSTRLQSLNPSPASTLTLAVNRKKADQVNLDWVWSGSGSVSNYEIHTLWNSSDTIIYSGTGTAISKFKIKFADKGDQICFLAKAQTATSTTVDSNTVCEIR
jgi:prepilin-type N-terminal cleavage/methylation domain-containing protein